jgi:hypothetical protein
LRQRQVPDAQSFRMQVQRKLAVNARRDKEGCVAGNLRSLLKVYRVVERYWRRMLCSRSRDGGRLTWEAFDQIRERNPLLRPKLRLPCRQLQALAAL